MISFQAPSQLIALIESEVVVVQEAVTKGIIRDRGARRDGDSRNIGRLGLARCVRRRLAADAAVSRRHWGTWDFRDTKRFDLYTWSLHAWAVFFRIWSFLRFSVIFDDGVTEDSQY